MSDEVDDLLRRAMATLDHQAPAEYFETLAARTLARLDAPALAEPAPPAARPSVAPLPAGDGLGADGPVGAPRPRTGGRRARILAAIGVGVAAAAGAVIFVSVRDRVANEPTLARAPLELRMDQAAEPSRVMPQGRETAGNSPAATSMAPSEPATSSGSAIAAKAAIENAASGRPGQRRIAPKGDEKPIGKMSGKLQGTTLDTESSAPGRAASAAPSYQIKPQPGVARGSGAGAPSFDKSKADRRTLGRTQLSSDDIERGMIAVAAQARACSDGTGGVATVQLSVAPSGRVQTVTVSGPFAGTSVATCVERAVRAAMFPPWDGAPQRFGYSYLLSE